MNTDKYEGHTEGPWNVYGPHPLHRHGDFDDEGIAQTLPFTQADVKLIADAPLLLQAFIDKQEEYTRFTLYAEAELKRLREAIADIANEIEAAELGYASTYVVRNPYTSKDVLQPRKIFEDLRKVILE